MSTDDAIRIAAGALSANKLRTFLTMLGVIIGVGAVIALVAAGQGAQNAVTARFAGLGANLLYIRPGSTTTAGVRSAAGTAPTLTMADATSIQQGVNDISAVVPESSSSVQLLYQGQNTNTRVTGTTPDYQTVMDWQVAEGSFFTQQDVDSDSPVLDLGATVAQTLFGTSDPVGQTVEVNTGSASIPFQVDGVMQAKGGTGLGDQDDQVVMPISTLTNEISSARNSTNGSQEVSEIAVEVSNKNDINTVTQNMTALLAELHNVDVSNPDFTIQSENSTVQALTASSKSFTILLGSIAGISLLVGGIGIMNIMLVSVTERTREIGIRKAVGARAQDIMLQFLIEALSVSLIGGLLGVGAGIGVAHFANGRTIAGEQFVTAISWQSIVLAFVVSAAIGVFFGIYPAMRASQMNPIEALRYE